MKRKGICLAICGLLSGGTKGTVSARSDYRADIEARAHHDNAKSNELHGGHLSLFGLIAGLWHLRCIDIPKIVSV